MLSFAGADKPIMFKRLAFVSAHASTDIPLLRRLPRTPRSKSVLPYVLAASAVAIALAAARPHHPLDASIRAQLYQQATVGQSSKAEVELGIAYRDGQYGLQRDLHAATGWFKKAAAAGDPNAAALLGDAYERGEGVAQDHVAALHWWHQAAAAGNAHATTEIGQTLMKQATTPFARDEAQQWLEEGAREGDAVARQAIGVDSAPDGAISGSGAPLLSKLYQYWLRIVPGDQDVATVKRHALDGDTAAQYRLALRYHDGSWGVKANAEKALSWLQQAAQHGNPVAMGTLADAYRQGSWGLSASPALARQWAERAAHVRAYVAKEHLL